MTENDHADIAQRVENGDIRPVAGTRTRGEAAKEAARQFVMDATRTSTPEEAWEVLRGRPRLSPEPNETVRVRIPVPLLNRARAIAIQQQTTVSQIIRDSLIRTVREAAA